MRFRSVLTSPRRRIRALLMTVLALWLPGVWAAAAEMATLDLQPGQYQWLPELAPAGPLVMLVSLPQQRAYVYRNGVRIGMASVSTGRPGFETPTGVFSILQKRREHYSNRYDDAPMPYMQRLTWDGVALHAGRVSGKPSSHGFVRLPEAFARKLFEVTERGMLVIVADQRSPAPAIFQPGFFAPVEADSGSPRSTLRVPDGEFQLAPELAPAGPLAVLISSSDAVLVVSRSGKEIGRTRIHVDPGTHFGLHAYLLLEGAGSGMSVVLPERRAYRWLTLTLPAHAPTGHVELDADALRRLRIPSTFASALYDLLTPGATVIVTDEPIDAPASSELTVLRSEAAASGPDGPRE